MYGYNTTCAMGNPSLLVYCYFRFWFLLAYFFWKLLQVRRGPKEIFVNWD